ncbi:hypothetical protein Syun_006792 [Stephania yunnanensis]|uniref:Uncharacterized protein n=1 Tax=Stephania yunnanensis TaxID=152371 RepID=A0AAP0Q1Q2_9MAGN
MDSLSVLARVDRSTTPEEGPRKSRSKSVPDSTRWPALARSSSSSPQASSTVRTRTPCPPLVANPFPGLRSILPTSLAYILPSTRSFTLETRCGYEYDRRERYSGPPDFQGSPGRTDTTNVRCSSSSPDPTSAEPFCGGQSLNVKDNSSRGPRRRLRLPNVAVNRRVLLRILTRFPFEARETRFRQTGLPRLLDRLTHVQVPFTWNLSPLRPSKFSFEYLLLPPRSAPTEAPPARALGFTSLPPRPPTHRGLTIAPTAGVGCARQPPSIFGAS